MNPKTVSSKLPCTHLMRHSACGLGHPHGLYVGLGEGSNGRGYNMRMHQGTSLSSRRRTWHSLYIGASNCYVAWLPSGAFRPAR